MSASLPVLGSLLHAVTGPLFHPLAREALYAANRRALLGGLIEDSRLAEFPPPDAILDCWLRGTWGTGNAPALRDSLALYGIGLGQDGPVSIPAGAQITGETLPRHYLYTTPGGVLEVNPDAQAVSTNAWDSVLLSRSWSPELVILLDLLRRGLISRDVADHFWHRLGIASPALASAVEKLTQVIPGPADLSHFAVRHVFDDEKFRQELGLAAEYPADFDVWARAQGLGVAEVIDPKTGRKVTRDFARAQWESHWVYTSPEQLYRFFQRLRPSRMGEIRETMRRRLQVDVDAGLLKPEDAVKLLADLKPFTYQDLLAGLRANDYLPSARPRLAATEYQLPGRIDLRRFRRWGLIDQSEVSESFQDLGYSPQVAELQARSMEQEFVENKIAAPRVITWYVKGVIGEVDARYRLERLGYRLEDVELLLAEARLKIGAGQEATRSQIKEAYQLGVIDDAKAGELLLGTGMRQPEVAAQITQMKFTVRIRFVKEATAQVRRRYLNAHITADEAASELRKIGVTAERISDLIQLWLIQFSGSQRQIALGKTLSLYIDHIISEGEVATRLHNLGYGDRDIKLLLGQAERAGAEADRTRARKGTKDVTAANVIGFYSGRLITRQQAYNRLRAAGYGPEDAELYLLLADRTSTVKTTAQKNGSTVQ